MLVSNFTLSYPSYPRVPRAPSIRGLTGGQIVSARINTARIISLQKSEIYKRGQQAVSPVIFLYETFLMIIVMIIIINKEESS